MSPDGDSTTNRSTTNNAAAGGQGDGGDDELELFPPSNDKLQNLVHPVLLAEGIHHQVTDGDLASLPVRFDRNSNKGRFKWFATLCLAGIGMFVEAYMIITTGQVKTIWYAQYPECWKPHAKQVCPNNIACCGLFPNTPFDNSTGTPVCVPQEPEFCTAEGTYPEDVLCDDGLTHSISYVEFAGIMVGMVTFGKIADWIGRVHAGILTSLFMLVGTGFMAFYSNPNSVSTIFLVFSITYFVFGWGVGGEYPLTAMSAAAYRAEQKLSEKDDDATKARQRILLEKSQAARRGETISIAFAMQGVGAVFGSSFLLFYLYFSGQVKTNCSEGIAHNSTGSDPSALNAVWRSFYLLGGLFCVMMFMYRALVEEETEDRKHMEERREQRKVDSHPPLTTRQILTFYAPRLVGTGGAWFLLDVAFYGLKLFSGPIFAEINPNGSLIVQNGYLLIYNLCGLLGYYCTAYLIDFPSIGRKKFTIISFCVQTFLFLLAGGIFNVASPGLLIFLFFLSNFTANCGVNVTIYVMAAETYPHEVRGTCHGLSAFLGKLGALVATIVFGTINVRTIFFVCGAVSAIGVVVTYVFSVDLTRVSLAEHDAQLEFLAEGHPELYKGRLNAPEHLSNYEKWTGRHGSYDPNWARKIIAESLHGAKADEFEL